MTDHAISIKQPWAWAILHAGKDVENRTWRTNYEGPIIIHDGKKIDKDGLKWMKEHGIEVPNDLPTGCYLGKVDIVGCRSLRSFKRARNSKWASGPVCWELKNPQAFDKPIPGLGRLGVFKVPEEIVKEVMAQEGHVEK